MIENLDRPIPELVEQLSIVELKTIQDALAREDAKLKARKEVFTAVLSRRFEAQARAAYTAAKKDTGTVNIAASNTLALKIEIDKKVEWSQPVLADVFGKMKPEDARHFAKLTYAVEEAKYKAATPDAQAKLKPARTVKAGKMKFTLVNAADAPQIEEAA